MPRFKIRYRVTVRLHGKLYYANKVEGMELPYVAWHMLEDSYPDHFSGPESLDIIMMYSDQKPTRYQIRVTAEEKEDA